MTPEETAIEQLRAIITAHDKRSEQARAMHDDMGERKRRPNLVIRCNDRRRCKMAEVFITASGVLIHQPGYKLSPAVNLDHSSEEGRAKNTLDGERRWKSQTYFSDQCLNLSLNCDHYTGNVLELQAIKDALTAGVNEIYSPNQEQ
ncbi:hypothetical protein [Neomicrococcus lactis]|uniref:hypothetical protein n=1 Tax=Neomicrococcus lactis TaxID=732241 RepID=UPI0022FFDFCC|nr:hypothetical protein [Neomicrococcus lactis]